MAGNFTYNCPHCDNILFGGFGDDVYCADCKKYYKTDWDYIDDDSVSGWLTEEEYVEEI